MKYVTFLNGPQEITMKKQGATASNPKHGKNKGKRGKKGKKNRNRRSLRNDIKALWESETMVMRAAKFVGSVVFGATVAIATQTLLSKTSWSPGAQDGVMIAGGMVLGGLATAFNAPRLGAGVAAATSAIGGGRATMRWMSDSSTAAVRAAAAAALGGGAQPPAPVASAPAASAPPAPAPAGLPASTPAWAYPTPNMNPMRGGVAFG